MERRSATATATSMPKPPFDLEAALREVARGHELASELHSLLRVDGRLEPALRLSRDVQLALASALAILTPRRARFRASLDPLALEISPPSAASSSLTAEPSTDADDAKNPRKRNLQSVPTNTYETCHDSDGYKTNDEKKVNKAKVQRNLQSVPTITYETCHDSDCYKTNEEKKINKVKVQRNLQSVTTITYETCHDGHCHKTNEEKKINKVNVQRNHLYSWTTTTCTPFNDGYQWRKYGEKKISQCAMPRCYYRCTHKDDQGCPATKQVQQKDTDDPPMFVVTYNKQHTCKNRNLLYGEQFVIESAITDPCQLSL